MQRTYPVGVSCWLDLETPDPDSAVAFYGGLFGWALDDAMPPQVPGEYFIATLDGEDVAAIASGAAAIEHGAAAWNTYFAVDDADAAATAVGRAGGRVTAAPEDNPGGRAAVCADPEGAPFRLWQAGRRVGAQVVNRAGGWNFSDLRTGDLEAAQAFYSSVFPWRFEDLGRTAIEVPGYGDHLEATADPGLRARQAGMPAGFADAIGAMVPTQEGEAPHWHVTFSVADRDASITAVEQLGGAVLSTSEWQYGRLAEVLDPQGAPFTLSQYTPRG